MSAKNTTLKNTFYRELVLFLVLLLAGLVALPIAVYIVGDAIFSDYSGGGFAGFYAALHSKLRAGEVSVWYLVLSPYLVWQLMRLTAVGFRRLRTTS